MKTFDFRILVTIICSLFYFNTFAQETEVQYLSGTGSDNTVDWEFFVTDGHQSGEWTKIPVPSNWEQFGFGKYNYGHAKDKERGKEEGMYKYEFEVPAEWKDKQIEIVFEGSMTDTEVKVNSKSAGPVHQGAFYRFVYDISDLLKPGQSNLLEVRVAKHSANNSVNKAERYADFWIFGGIFRPVYLQVKPFKNIKRVAVDAQADGDFKAEVYLKNAEPGDHIKAQVMTLNNEPVGASFSGRVESGSDKVQLQSHLKEIKTWNPEHPNLYKVNFELHSRGDMVHKNSARFGFRTVEIRKRDGIYVNGVKIKFKGVNRHTFWPTTGRASNKSRSIEDVKLMKDMNMNAVRMSHYPPDTHFLKVADSLGLFVINELAGWHDAYDTGVGSNLVEAMVNRDINHPSIIFWSNGNEGGHNTDLDSVFKEFDIQNREVIHPWESFNGMATQHYRPYNYGAGTFWNGHKIVLPTEFLHGMYDGGSGAGLYDFWELIRSNPRAAGGFLWVFADEGVQRTDNGKIDTYNASAADGIMGPYHEKEGSYFAIKEIWSPVSFEDIDISVAFEGTFNVENRYFYTNLKKVAFSWKLTELPGPMDDYSSKKEISGTSNAPDVKPGHIGELKLDLPDDWYSYDVLYITATDHNNNELYTWSWPIALPEDVIEELMQMESSKEGEAVAVNETDSEFIVKAGSIQYNIGKNDGLLKKVVNSKGEIPFNNGPVLSAGEVIFNSIETRREKDKLILVSSFSEESRMKEFTWTFHPSGWAELELYYKPEEYDVDFDFMGVDFSYPEELVKGVKWLGNGPYRVWKNRLHGVELDVHQKDYNNTITGVPPVEYPEFKGYHSNFYWAKIQSKEQSFTVATSTEDVFLRLYTPDDPEPLEERTAPSFPEGDISFMQAIPAIGSKSNQPERLGPSGRKNIFFDYGTFDDWRKRSKKMTLFFDFSNNQ